MGLADIIKDKRDKLDKEERQKIKHAKEVAEALQKIPMVEKIIPLSKTFKDGMDLVEDKDKFEQLETDEYPNPLNGLGKEEKLSAMESLLQPMKEEPGLKDKMFGSEYLEQKTRLTPQLTLQIANMKMVSLLNDLPELELYLEDYMGLRISLLGEGRKEAVDMVKGESLYGFANDVAQRTKG